MESHGKVGKREAEAGDIIGEELTGIEVWRIDEVSPFSTWEVFLQKRRIFGEGTRPVSHFSHCRSHHQVE
jgi:hypothetical protein